MAIRRVCICLTCPACTGRPHTFEKDSSPGRQRCAPCQQYAQQQREQTRPSPAARGYGYQHARTAKAVIAQAIASNTGCCYCGRPPQPDDPFVGCHIYAQSRGGPQDGPLAAGHRSCNARAAGRLRKTRKRR